MPPVVQQVFTASASVTATLPPGGSIVALPPVDANNPALTVANEGQFPIGPIFGTTADLPLTFGNASEVVAPGDTVLLPTVAADALYASIPTQGNVGGNVVLTRGSVQSQTVFSE